METEEKKKELLTLVVLSYMQERYIREAVQGAFSQTYSPLEIILSDDCSSDSTFEIMQEMAEAYSGPHTVVLNRNQSNLGLADHINRIGALVSGELLIISAADDVSLPNRVARIGKEWESCGKKADLIYSSAREISEDGKDLFIRDEARIQQYTYLRNARELLKYDSYALGASCAITVKLLRQFPPLMPSLICEDHIWPLRARLLGGAIRYIDEPLVLHRTGGISDRIPRGVRVLSFRQKLLDLESGPYSPRLLKDCQRYLLFWKIDAAKAEGRKVEEEISPEFRLWYGAKILTRFLKFRPLRRKVGALFATLTGAKESF